MALLIYTERLNPRISYVFQHIFANILGIDFLFSHDFETFKAHAGAKIIYTAERFADGLSFKKHSIIDEEFI